MTYFANEQDMRMIKSAQNRKLLSREREAELARRWLDHKDHAALHELVLAYQKIVVKAAKNFSRYGSNFEDLVQEGTIALMKAADNFDPDRGFRFGTYAFFNVRAAMQEYIMTTWSIMKTVNTGASKALFFTQNKLRKRAIDTLRKEGVDDPTEDQIITHIAAALKAPEDTIRAYIDVMKRPMASLNSRVGGEETSELGDFIRDDSPTPEDIAEQNHDRAHLKKVIRDALAQLDDRDQKIIAWRYLSESPETLAQVAAKLDISRERVRQLEARACQSLKKLIPGGMSLI